jgi:hypothetical protein
MKNILAIALLTASSLVLAHHSPAVFYHMDQEVTMSGTVTEFRMGNPHIRVYFEKVNDAGETEQWMAEGGSRTVLLRHGWTGDEVKPGDAITVIGNPSREEKNIVHMIDITFANGETRFAEDLNPSTTERLLEQRRRRRD